MAKVATASRLGHREPLEGAFGKSRMRTGSTVRSFEVSALALIFLLA
jgi:hypothetical protein